MRTAGHLGQAIEVDPALVQTDQQPEPALLVLEQPVVAVTAGQAGTQLRRLDRADRRSAQVVRAMPSWSKRRRSPARSIVMALVWPGAAAAANGPCRINERCCKCHRALFGSPRRVPVYSSDVVDGAFMAGREADLRW